MPRLSHDGRGDSISGLLIVCHRLISPNTNIIYNQYARSRNFEPDTVALAHGAQGHWVGNKNATNVLIWFHGQSRIRR